VVVIFGLLVNARSQMSYAWIVDGDYYASSTVVSHYCSITTWNSAVVDSASYYVVSFQSQEISKNPFFVSNFITLRKSVIVSLNVTKPGIVYCNAFNAGYSLSVNSIPRMRSDGEVATSVSPFQSLISSYPVYRLKQSMTFSVTGKTSVVVACP